MAAKITMHMLGNSHLDPVWQWDWREGAMEAVSTCRTMVQLMKECPELTYLRGEAWLYEQIEQSDPALFDTIRRLVAAGRWEPVGGSYVQSDANLPATTTMLRQFAIGKRYFAEKFHRDITAAWFADSFGQSAGMPEIYAAGGIRYLAFSRPAALSFALEKPLFRWRGRSGKEILCYRNLAYYSDRDSVGALLDQYLAQARATGLSDIAVFYGLGDHGGGPSRRQLRDIAAWRKEHEQDAKVCFSTLHGFFAAAECNCDALPVITGEINFCGRGYYAANAGFKAEYRDTEAALKRATLITGKPLTEAWKGLCFNTFHDILPGTSVESAYTLQTAWLGGIRHRAALEEFTALRTLAARIDTRCAAAADDFPEAVPFLVYNPHPHPYRGAVELEFSPDYRPVWQYAGKAMELPLELRDEAGNLIPFQRLKEEHNFLPDLPQRCRILFRTEIPPGGWRCFRPGYVEKPGFATNPIDAERVTATEDGLANRRCRIAIDRENNCLRFWRDSVELFGGVGMRFTVSRDVWGSWGSFGEEPEAFTTPMRLESWSIAATKILESGPERAALWVRFTGTASNSEAEVILRLKREEIKFELDIRVLWNARAVRLQLLTAAAETVTYAVPGGVVTRDCMGDVPGGRWLSWQNGPERIGIINDRLCGFGNYADGFGITLLRGNRYCSSDASEADEFPEQPICDRGSHRFALHLVPGADDADLRRLADELEMPPLILQCDRHEGTLSGCGSGVAVTPKCVTILDRDMNTVTLQNLSGQPVTAELTAATSRQVALAPWEILTVPFVRGDPGGGDFQDEKEGHHA